MGRDHRTRRGALLAYLAHGRDQDGTLIVEGFTVRRHPERSTAARWLAVRPVREAERVVFTGATQTVVLEQIVEWLDSRP